MDVERQNQKLLRTDLTKVTSEVQIKQSWTEWRDYQWNHYPNYKTLFPPVTVVQQDRSKELSEEAYESSIRVCTGLGGEFPVGEGYCWIP